MLGPQADISYFGRLTLEGHICEGLPLVLEKTHNSRARPQLCGHTLLSSTPEQSQMVTPTSCYPKISLLSFFESLVIPLGNLFIYVPCNPLLPLFLLPDEKMREKDFI